MRWYLERVEALKNKQINNKITIGVEFEFNLPQLYVQLDMTPD